MGAGAPLEGRLVEILEESPHMMQNVSLFVLKHVVVRAGKLYNLRERVGMIEVRFP